MEAKITLPPAGGWRDYRKTCVNKHNQAGKWCWEGDKYLNAYRHERNSDYCTSNWPEEEWQWVTSEDARPSVVMLWGHSRQCDCPTRFWKELLGHGTHCPVILEFNPFIEMYPKGHFSAIYGTKNAPGCEIGIDDGIYSLYGRLYICANLVFHAIWFKHLMFAD